jgi:NAD(P)-dependent dehydrogenase (short-subunit alcohol dehydrogenase family)
MKLVVADIEQGPAEEVASQLRDADCEALAVRCDVSDPDSMEELASRAHGHFGSINLLVNNAGVFLRSDPPEATAADWEWIFGVNVFGVVNGLHAFLPRMRTHAGFRHIVNVASLGGLAAGFHTGIAAYTASKFAVVGLSEQLRLDLAPEGIGVTVVCPAGMPTNIMNSERNRPGARYPPVSQDPSTVGNAIQAGMDTHVVAELTINAVLHNRSHVVNARGPRDVVLRRFGDIAEAFAHTPA